MDNSHRSYPIVVKFICSLKSTGDGCFSKCAYIHPPMFVDLHLSIVSIHYCSQQPWFASTFVSWKMSK